MEGTTAITVPKMLTIRQTAATKILPENALRAMLRRGELPGCYCGAKYMVNLDRLIEQLNGGAVDAQ